MSDTEIFWLWEQLVRRGCAAAELARYLKRDPKDIALWCTTGCPTAYVPLVTPYFGKIKPEFFNEFDELPKDWMRIALSDGAMERRWVQDPGAVLTIAQARHLDALGFGVLMHRPFTQLDRPRAFTLEFHLLRGAVNYKALP